MSVNLVFGLPRSGKTSFLTWAGLRALKGKSVVCGYGLHKFDIGDFAPYERVYSNFPLSGAYQLDFSQLGKVTFENCLILIDEIMLLCDSREWKNYGKELRNFMALHGHWKVDILACSQGYSDCDVRIRNLAEKLFYLRRYGSWSSITPIEKKWRIDETIQDGYSLQAPLCSRFIYRPRLYKYFDSFARPELPENPAEKW